MSIASLLGPKDHASASPIWSPDGAGAGHAGVLLHSWLPASTGHPRTVLGHGRALPGVGELPYHNLVYQRLVHGYSEDIVPYFETPRFSPPGIGNLEFQATCFPISETFL